MRILLLALPALALVTPTREADACGGSYDFAPRVMQVSTHFTGGSVRSFVVRDAATPDPRLVWTRLAPRTFDYAEVAGGTQLARPIQFTIVGRDGTKIVTGTTERFLSQTFTLHAPARVVEVPAVPASMTIAIEGAHADATWIGLEAKDRSLRVKGTAIEVVIGYEGTDPVTTLQRDGHELGRYTGRAIGVVAVGGARRLVLVDGARTTSHALP